MNPRLISRRRLSSASLMSQAARGLRSVSVENDAHRERARELYATGDPERYIRQIFGWTLARDQRRLIQVYLESTQLLAVGANATGKSAALAAMVLGWTFDAAGSMLVKEDGRPRGCVILIVAATGDAGLEAYQKHFLELGIRSRDRGHLLPGWGSHSPKSVSWQPMEGRWYMRRITAPATAGADEVSHHVLGAHHSNMVAWLEEVKAISPAVVEALKGRLRGADNRAVGSTNPTSAEGLGYQLSQVSRWPTVYSSAVGRIGHGDGESRVEQLEAHENVQQRREVFPGAVSHVVVEADLRDQRNFEIRGKLWNSSGEPPEGFCRPKAEAGDFPYALSPIGLEDVLGPRKDGYPGHPNVDVLVIRPLTGRAYGVIVGGWPPVDPRSLFGAYMLGKAVELGLSVPDVEGPPRVVGVDASYAEGGDEMIGTPWWGKSCRDLLELAWEARPGSGSSVQDGAQVLMMQHSKLKEFWEKEVMPNDGQISTQAGVSLPGVPDGHCSGSHVIQGASASVPSDPGRSSLNLVQGVNLQNGLTGTNFPGVPAIIGEPYSLAVTKSGAEAANQLVTRWGTIPIYQVDLGGGHGVGSSLKALGCTVRWMQFGGAAAKPLPSQERAAFNARSEWAFSLADAIGLGLVVMCRDRKAHEDLIAFGVPELKERAAPRGSGTGARVEVMKLQATELIKKMLGRSPDRGASILCASARPIVMTWK